MPADRPSRDRPNSGRPRARPDRGSGGRRDGRPDGRSAGGRPSGRRGDSGRSPGSRPDGRGSDRRRDSGNPRGRDGGGSYGEARDRGFSAGSRSAGSRSDRGDRGDRHRGSDDGRDAGRESDRPGRYRGDGRDGSRYGADSRGGQGGRSGRSTSFRSGAGRDRDGRGRDAASRTDFRGRDDRPSRDGRGRDGRGRDGWGRDGRGRDGRGRDDAGRDERSRDGRSRDSRDSRKYQRPEPRTEAERRAEEVRRRRGPRVERSEDHERNKIEARTTEDWIDEGPVIPEDSVEAAPKGPTQRRDVGEVAPIVIAAIYDVAGPSRGAKHVERLARAAGALDRERFGDAKRMLSPLLKEIPNVAAVQEVAGLIAYGQARWADAAGHLELARRLNEDVALLPVLADAYRAQRRWDDVDDVWADIRSASPNQEIMAEGRIVAASALGDQHRYREAVQLLEPAAKAPKRIRDYHLRQWYVLGDLYDRAGDQVAATRWFRLVVAQDADFADARERLRQLGR